MLQGNLQILAGSGARGRQDAADTAIEAFDHAFGLGTTLRDQAVLDAVRRAFAVEGVVSRGLL